MCRLTSSPAVLQGDRLKVSLIRLLHQGQTLEMRHFVFPLSESRQRRHETKVSNNLGAMRSKVMVFEEGRLLSVTSIMNFLITIVYHSGIF